MFDLPVNSYEEIVSETPIVDENIVKLIIKADVSTRKIYLKIPNYGIIPEDKQGAGNKAWTFIDEIIVN